MTAIAWRIMSKTDMSACPIIEYEKEEEKETFWEQCSILHISFFEGLLWLNDGKSCNGCIWKKRTLSIASPFFKDVVVIMVTLPRGFDRPSIT